MEFTINGNTYRSGKLNAFQQQDLAFALVPAFGALAPLLKGENFNKDNLMDALPAISEAVRALGKKERTEINDICLSAVSRQSGDAWSRIYSNEQLMYDDINGIDLFKIVGHVIQESLSSFFPVPAVTDKPA